MAVVDCAVHLRSRFDCPQAQDAGPFTKRAHVVADISKSQSSHCLLELALGTFGPSCEKVNVNFYTGHVPDAPVLLGPEQAKIYQMGVAKTGWGMRRLCAVGVAASVGCFIGAVVSGLSIGVLAVSHIVAPSLVGPIVWPAANLVAAAACTLAAFVMVKFESDEWSALRQQLQLLLQMATCQEGDAKAAAALVIKGQASSDWALQQAALELEGMTQAA